MLVTHTRARGASGVMQTDLLDLLEPPGRRCGCWPTSQFLLSFPSGFAGPAADET
jgi:hypothetical protein